MKKLILVLAVLVWACSSVKAQESGLNFSVGADLVSSYVWRGAYSAKASFQPAASLSIGNFSLSAWASTEIVDLDEVRSQKEVDFTAGYSIAGLSLAITDYWWEGEGAYKYLKYGDGTAHLWEGSLGYTLPVESFPLSLSANVIFAGADKKEEEDKNNYSTYIEAFLPFAIKDINLSASLGATPGKGLYASQASVVNISLKASKEIKITDSFSLPVFGQIILNPNAEDIFFVFGISL
ncbi:MAG: hypothetical protein LBR97_09405 [Dysgonamonadaceae bacterium]|jgi:hypothetical protein|nr:hypothetical protein [Dysgonamonadaceae bacterium]